MSAPRMQELYDNQVVKALNEEFKYSNPHQVPQLVKIVANMGLGEAVQNPKIIEGAQKELSQITGQRAIVTRAKQSIATFKLRQGDPVGLSATLRGDRMWFFLEKLINVAIPRIRDFNGIKHGFDRRGNYAFGLNDQTIFPEVRIDKITRQQGLDVCFTISGGSDDMSRSLLEGLGFPLKRKKEKGKA